VLGGPETRNREVLAFGTGFRNISAALVVVSANFEDPQILFMVLVIAVFGVILMTILGGWLYRKNKQEARHGRSGVL
jgi:predicted Na+-dependent transporter